VATRRQPRKAGRRSRADVLATVARAASPARASALVPQRIADALRHLLGVESAAVHRLDPDSGALVAVAVSGDAGTAFGEKLVFPKGTGVAALALRRGRPVATPDVLADRRVTLTPEVRARIERAGYRAVLAVPLLTRNGPIGALGLGARKGRRFSRGEIALKFATQLADEARPPEVAGFQLMFASTGDKLDFFAVEVESLAYLRYLRDVFGDLLKADGKYFVFAGNVDISKKYMIELDGIPFHVLPLDEATVYNELLELVGLERNDLKKLETDVKLAKIAEAAAPTPTRKRGRAPATA